jgi:hypothetical protein
MVPITPTAAKTAAKVNIVARMELTMLIAALMVEAESIVV